MTIDARDYNYYDDGDYISHSISPTEIEFQSHVSDQVIELNEIITHVSAPSNGDLGSKEVFPGKGITHIPPQYLPNSQVGIHSLACIRILVKLNDYNYNNYK